MLPGRPYWMKIAPSSERDDHRAQVQGERQYARAPRAKKLALNEIGVCNVALDHPIAFDPTPRIATRRFILIDRLSNATSARPDPLRLRRSQNIHWQALDIHKARAPRSRAEALRAVVHRPVGRGQVHHRQPRREAAARARPPHLPAGRRQRAPRPERDLGFTDTDRVENIRRVPRWPS